MLEIAEEPFLSLQGEGILSGTPMMFVRLARCNLRCTECDTAYAQDKGTMTPLESIMEHLWTSSVRWVCITGGEPLLHNIDDLVEAIVGSDRRVTVETNGLLAASTTVFIHTSLWTVSPKMTNSGRSEKQIEESMANVARFVKGRRVQLKFICRKPTDVAEALEYVQYVEKHYNASMQDIPVIIQPQAFATDKVEDNLAVLRQLWKLMPSMLNLYPYDIRVMPQLHRLLYGMRRRV